MKALLLRQPRDLAILDTDRPAASDGDVLLRVTGTGVCGTDLKIFTGAMPAALPLVMGHEVVGEVAEGVSGLSAGTRVVVDPVLYCGRCEQCRGGLTNLCPNGAVVGREVNGGFAEYVAVPRTHVFPLPDSIDSLSAPLIQVLTTCLHAQRRAGPCAGRSVAVVGLGVCGQLHVQLAKARGASPVVGVTRSAWKRAMAEHLGADGTCASGAGCAGEVRDATGGQGADLVIECTGHLQALADAIGMVRPGGTVLLFGITTATDGRLPFYQLYYKEPTLVTARAATSEDFPASIDLVARGAVRLSPLVTHVLTTWDLPEALRMLESDVDGRMKIVLRH